MFMKYASGNTKKGHETLGYLAGPKEQEGNHIVTTLIVPKQKTATDSCESTEEESVLAMFESKNLVLLGWIHTHPCHRLFFSSTDMHMQLEIQKMFKEAIGIVVSTDGDFRVKNLSVFHLTDLGVSTIRACELGTTSHRHMNPKEDFLYEECGFVPKDRFLVSAPTIAR